jgi:hypothetical protein
MANSPGERDRSELAVGVSLGWSEWFASMVICPLLMGVYRHVNGQMT